MFIEFVLAVGIGAFVGATAAYASTRHRRSRIHFYEESRLEEALELFDIPFEKNAKCAICGTEITFENVGLVRKVGDKVYETCNEHDLMPSDEIEFAHL